MITRRLSNVHAIRFAVSLFRNTASGFAGFVVCLATLGPAMPILAADKPAPSDGTLLATVRVEAGDHARHDTPVSVDVPADFDPWAPMRLVEVVEGKTVERPYQVEALPPNDSGKTARLWFILAGRTAAGAARTFELRVGNAAAADAFSMKFESGRLVLSAGDRTVFAYNHAHVEPPGKVNRLYRRSAYIHPLYSPSGMLITEDFPSDHYHHKGIWFPWTETAFEGHPVDFWNLGKGQGTVRFAGYKGIESGPIFAGFKARHRFIDLSQDKPRDVLSELWHVRIWRVGVEKGRADRWLFDLTSTQRCASDSPLLLKKYRYGGLGFRGAKEWKDDNYVVLSSEGKTKKDGHTTRSRWCDHSGAIDGKWSGVTILSHPENYRHPEPMRIWDKGGAFFNYAPVQAGDWTLEPGRNYVFRYRFFVHEGKVDAEVSNGVWNDFAKPPQATFTPDSL